MFASFCFDHILFWQALCMRACVGLSWFSIPLCNCCVNSSEFSPLPFTLWKQFVCNFAFSLSSNLLLLRDGEQPKVSLFLALSWQRLLPLSPPGPPCPLVFGLHRASLSCLSCCANHLQPPQEPPSFHPAVSAMGFWEHLSLLFQTRATKPVSQPISLLLGS